MFTQEDRLFTVARIMQTCLESFTEMFYIVYQLRKNLAAMLRNNLFIFACSTSSLKATIEPSYFIYINIQYIIT